MLYDLEYMAALMSEWELDIEIELVHADGSIHPAIITALYDADNCITWRPADAHVAVGEYIDGPHAGRPVVISDPDVDELKLHIH